MKCCLIGGLLVSSWLAGFSAGAELTPQRSWQNQSGKSFNGLFIRSDGVNAWIKPGTNPVVQVPLADLSAPDQAAIVALNTDLSWKLRNVRWPTQVSAPATRPASQVTAKRTDTDSEYRTTTFSFLSDQPLDPKLVGEFGRVFEASYELMRQLPWDVRPTPPDAGTLFRARLMSQRTAFLKAIDEKDVPGTVLKGVYQPKDGQIYVPFDSLGLKQDRGAWVASGAFTNDTLRHELAHEMMQDLLPVLPWWVAEGTAEYVRIIPWDGHGGYEVSKTGTITVMRKIAEENEFNSFVLNSLLKPEYSKGFEIQAAALTAGRLHLETYLLKARTDREAWVARLQAELQGKKPPPVPVQTLPAPREIKFSEAAVRPMNFEPRGQPEIISKYHAAKVLVYYLQHLEGDGKGTKMLKLMWRLRQWADELAPQRKAFDLAFASGIKALEELEVKVKALPEQDKAWSKEMQAYVMKFQATGKLPPVPPGPEEVLIKLLPTLPVVDQLTSSAMEARWNTIQLEAIPQTPDDLAKAIVAAFDAKKVTLLGPDSIYRR